MPRFPKSSAFKMKGAPYKKTDDLSKTFIGPKIEDVGNTKKYTYTFDASKRQEIPTDKKSTRGKVGKTYPKPGTSKTEKILSKTKRVGEFLLGGKRGLIKKGIAIAAGTLYGGKKYSDYAVKKARKKVVKSREEKTNE